MPVSVSNVRIFLPSLPMIRPFISSLGRFTTETVDSVVCSAANLCTVVASNSLAVLSTFSFASFSFSLTSIAISCDSSSSTL